MATSGDRHPAMKGDRTEEQKLDQPGKAPAGNKGSVTDQVSNDMSDAKEIPEDTVPKDNSHNFT